MAAGSEKTVRIVLIIGIIVVFGFAAVIGGTRYGGQITRLFGNKANNSTKSVDDEDWETFDYIWEEAGESFAVMDGQFILTIKEAAVAESEDSGIEGFPQEDKLIAVPAKIQTAGEDSAELAIGEIYVRYLSGAGQYEYKKNILSKDLAAFDRDYGTELDVHNFSNAVDADGNFMFFIDPEATEIDVYLSELNLENEIQAVYRINLKVMEKEDKRNGNVMAEPETSDSFFDITAGSSLRYRIDRGSDARKCSNERKFLF